MKTTRGPIKSCHVSCNLFFTFILKKKKKIFSKKKKRQKKKKKKRKLATPIEPRGWWHLDWQIGSQSFRSACMDSNASPNDIVRPS
jgi:hypothetical protein